MDFLASQLARNGVVPHALTPVTRRPWYLPKVGYPYASVVVERDASRVATALRDMIDRVQPACIIPCMEESLYWLWEQPDAVQRLCLPQVPVEQRPLLLDRARFIAEAARWGVPVPDSADLRDRDDCRGAASAGLPVVVKAAQSVSGGGVAFCHTAADVVAAFERFSAAGLTVSAQRYYTGPTYVAGGLFIDGEPVHFYGAEMTFKSPASGYALTLETVGGEYFEAMLAATRTVGKHLNWTGMAGFDFVRDDVTDTLRLVDFNPRYWGSGAAMVDAQVDFYAGLASWITDGTVSTPTRSVPGVSHRVFPKYTLDLSSGVSMPGRLRGLRDAPWGDASFVLGEAAFSVGQLASRRIIKRLESTWLGPRLPLEWRLSAAEDRWEHWPAR
jgi:hypothetical protein